MDAIGADGLCAAAGPNDFPTHQIFRRVVAYGVFYGYEGLGFDFGEGA